MKIDMEPSMSYFQIINQKLLLYVSRLGCSNRDYFLFFLTSPYVIKINIKSADKVKGDNKAFVTFGFFYALYNFWVFSCACLICLHILYDYIFITCDMITFLSHMYISKPFNIFHILFQAYSYLSTSVHDQYASSLNLTNLHAIISTVKPNKLHD